MRLSIGTVFLTSTFSLLFFFSQKLSLLYQTTSPSWRFCAVLYCPLSFIAFIRSRELAAQVQKWASANLKGPSTSRNRQKEQFSRFLYSIHVHRNGRIYHTKSHPGLTGDSREFLGHRLAVCVASYATVFYSYSRNLLGNTSQFLRFHQDPKPSTCPHRQRNFLRAISLANPFYGTLKPVPNNVEGPCFRSAQSDPTGPDETFCRFRMLQIQTKRFPDVALTSGCCSKTVLHRSNRTLLHNQQVNQTRICVTTLRCPSTGTAKMAFSTDNFFQRKSLQGGNCESLCF